MRSLIIFISILLPARCFSQVKNITGTFTSDIASPKCTLTFNDDSTFNYTSIEDPVFYRWNGFFEKGKWTLCGDTIILNPQLPKKVFIESDFTEQENYGDTGLLLTFNHIKRFFDANDNIIKTDTVQIERLDFALNEQKKKQFTRVASCKTTRCSFAGYIPKEIITPNRTIAIQRPAVTLQRIFVGCYELQGTKVFTIKNPASSHLTLNVYSNYYQQGQIRQKKILVKNDNLLYTKQHANGEFYKDNAWRQADLKLKRQVL